MYRSVVSSFLFEDAGRSYEISIFLFDQNSCKENLPRSAPHLPACRLRWGLAQCTQLTSGKLPFECQKIAKKLSFFKQKIAKNFHFFK